MEDKQKKCEKQRKTAKQMTKYTKKVRKKRFYKTPANSNKHTKYTRIEQQKCFLEAREKATVGAGRGRSAAEEIRGEEG